MLKRDLPKVRRRGGRLIVEYRDQKAIYIGRDSLWELSEFFWQGNAVRQSRCGCYFLFEGKVDGTGIEFIRFGDINGETIAERSDGFMWLFVRPGTNEIYISLDDVPITNAALVAGSAEHMLEPGLATFLNVNPLLCATADIIKIYDDPRYARLRDFKFEVKAPDVDLGSGRRAVAKARHKHTNYDIMLQKAGGLLHPEPYERLRRGVDRIVKQTIRDGQ
jgi:hypothetical protein